MSMTLVASAGWHDWLTDPVKIISLLMLIIAAAGLRLAFLQQRAHRSEEYRAHGISLRLPRSVKEGMVADFGRHVRRVHEMLEGRGLDHEQRLARAKAIVATAYVSFGDVYREAKRRRRREWRSLLEHEILRQVLKAYGGPGGPADDRARGPVR